MRRILGLVLAALAFSISYAFVEYYLIRDTTFGYNPMLFSLLYPYHLGMAAAFGLASYGLLRSHNLLRGRVQSLILACALFSSMLAVEDFTWFALRASAPLEGDLNAGSLILPGEWTTQFIGSVDLYFTAIPNWYFLSVGFLAASAMTREKRRLAALASV